MTTEFNLERSLLESRIGELEAEIEQLRMELARAHWNIREQQRVNSELETALEVYASTANWDGREWRCENNGWVVAQRALARQKANSR